MPKEFKETQLCDSKLPRKKAQDAQDNVIKLFDLFDARFCGRKGIKNVDSQRQPSPVQLMDVCVILAAFFGFIVSGERLKQLGAFRASCRNPKNRVATRSNVRIWRAHFWSCLLIKNQIENSR